MKKMKIMKVVVDARDVKKTAKVAMTDLVADVLGHSSVDTTRKHYADMTDARRKMAAEHVHLPGDPEF